MQLNKPHSSFFFFINHIVLTRSKNTASIYCVSIQHWLFISCILQEKNENIHYQQLLVLIRVQIWLVNMSFTVIMYSLCHFVFHGREPKFTSPVIRFSRYFFSYFLPVSSFHANNTMSTEVTVYTSWSIVNSLLYVEAFKRWYVRLA